MAKKPIVDELIENHGPCKSCGEVVDVLVEMHQIVGRNRLICVDCRIGRIEAKAEAQVEAIRGNAEKARAAAAQGLLEFEDIGEDEKEEGE